MSSLDSLIYGNDAVDAVPQPATNDFYQYDVDASYEPNGHAHSHNHYQTPSALPSSVSVYGARPAPQRQPPYKLFVGQLVEAMDNAALRAMFVPFGELVDAVILLEKGASRSKKCGFVTYVRSEDAAAAVAALDGKMTIPGARRSLIVQWAQNTQDPLTHRDTHPFHPPTHNEPPMQLPPSHASAQRPEDVSHDWKLYVNNIDLSNSEAGVHNLFAPYGRIVEIHLMREKVTGQLKGTAFVRFSHRDEASAAIQALHGKIKDGNAPTFLSVRFADGTREHARAKAERFLGNRPPAQPSYGSNGNGFQYEPPQQQQHQQQQQQPPPQYQPPQPMPSTQPPAQPYASSPYYMQPAPAVGYAPQPTPQPVPSPYQQPLPTQYQPPPPADPRYPQPHPGQPPPAHYPQPAPSPYAPPPQPYQPAPPAHYHPPQPHEAYPLPAAAPHPAYPSYPPPPQHQPAQLQQPPPQWGAPPAYPPAPQQGPPPRLSGDARGPDGANLLVDNLPYDFSDDDLFGMFGQHGQLLSARIVRDTNRRSRGHGYVSYSDVPNAMNAARALDGLTVGGRRIEVRIKPVGGRSGGLSRDRYRPY